MNKIAITGVRIYYLCQVSTNIGDANEGFAGREDWVTLDSLLPPSEKAVVLQALVRREESFIKGVINDAKPDGSQNTAESNL
jgi:hypothetical protein